MKKTVIEGGLLVDGTRREPFVGDLVIEGDKIADVLPPNSRAGEGADFVYDAHGLLVAPGFVDAHAHSDAYLLLEPHANSKIAQGVTTEVNGQCGGSAAPRFGEARLSSDWASLLGDRLTWRSFASYRETLERTKIAVNTVSFVGHNTLRSSVVGYAGRAATADECRAMVRLLDESLDAGAKGLTTGLIYQPGVYATEEELFMLVRETAKKGGFYATHMRSEGDRLLESIDEVLALVRETGVRAEISHLKTSGPKNWGKIDRVLEKVEEAVETGLLLGSDRYPYCAAGTDLDVVLPDWAQEGAAKSEVERLRDGALRERIAHEIDESGRDWSRVVIGGTWAEENKIFSGRSVSEILCAGENDERDLSDERDERQKSLASLKSLKSLRHLTPGQLVCDILLADACRTGAFFFSMSEENLDKILLRPWIVPGSDASLRATTGPLAADFPHPRAYGTMPTFYSRLRKLGLSREEAISRMTSVPAKRFGLTSRGVLEKGAFADVVVLDESSFASPATYLAPHAYATGVRLVTVNGAVAYRDGVFLARAGRMI